MTVGKVITITFCQRCNTDLENHMRFCWNCGMPVHPQQVHGGGPPMQAQAHVHRGHGHYQESYTVSTGGPNPYQQSVTVSHGGTGHGPPTQHHVHHQGNKVTLPCPYCDGDGTHPMNFDQPCPICRGAGSISVHEPYTTCQHCDGSGKKFATMDEICPACHGRGVIQM